MSRATAVKRARMIREVMLDHGVPEVSIELVEGRPSGSDRWNALNPVGVLSHHIASRPSPSNPTPGLSLVKRGRSDLPGPLCNGTAGVDLVYRIVTLGYANHSGYGGPWRVSGPLGSFTVPGDQGRPYLWGTEYEGGYTDWVWDQTYTNRRTGKSMTFREFMGRCNAALVEAIWLPGLSTRDRYRRITPGMDLSGYHGEHATWTSRKIDRRNYSTHDGRAEIRRYHEEEDPMAQISKDWLDGRFDRLDEKLNKVVEDAERVRAGSYKRDTRLRKKMNERFGATEEQLDEILGELDAEGK